MREAYEILAGRDLQGTRRAAEALAGPNRRQALSGVAMTWAEKNGPAALEWAESLKEDGDRYDAMRAVLLGWARTDPHAALDRIGLVPVGGNQMHYASTTGARVLREASKADFEATVAWLRANSGKVGYEDLIGMSQGGRAAPGCRSPSDSLRSRKRRGPWGF